MIGIPGYIEKFAPEAVSAEIFRHAIPEKIKKAMNTAVHGCI